MDRPKNNPVCRPTRAGLGDLTAETAADGLIDCVRPSSNTLDLGVLASFAQCAAEAETG